MSACFSIGLGFGEKLCFAESADIFKTLPATLMVTLGGFITNAVYCFYQNSRNKSWGDYGKKSLYVNNVLFCALAGVLWYSQFFGLSLGKGFLADSPVLLTFSWCILMSLNVTFSNVWGNPFEGMERVYTQDNYSACHRLGSLDNFFFPATVAGVSLNTYL